MNKKEKRKLSGNPDEILEKLKSGENPATSLLSSFYGKFPDILLKAIIAKSVFSDSITAEIRTLDPPSPEEVKAMKKLLKEISSNDNEKG